MQLHGPVGDGVSSEVTMNCFRFQWSEPTALSAELIKPIAQISLRLGTHERAMNATLWRTDRTGLRIRPQMHEIAERKEVGVTRV